jgi:hypothetical protein
MKTILRTTIQDLRYAFRQLIKLPGFTLTAVISLALGIGATTAVFSVVYAILMDPYPYKAPDRMVHMRLVAPTGDLRGFGVTATQWQELRKSPVIEDTFLEDDWNLTVTGSDFPEDLQAVYLTSNGFNFFGVPAFLGRGLQPSDAIDGQDPQPIAVLGYKFWQRHFNADRSVIGKTIQMVRKNYTASPRHASPGATATSISRSKSPATRPEATTSERASSPASLSPRPTPRSSRSFRSSLARPPRTSLTMRSAFTSSASMKTSSSSSAARSICSSAPSHCSC